jgi:CP family cyanate transporter-like MFS transporter
MATTLSPPRGPDRATAGTAAALILVAINLRLAIAAVPPVLAEIRHSTGLSSAGGGVLTAIPVFCFGIVALLSPRLIRRLGMRPLLLVVLAMVLAGVAVRLLSGVPALLLGTAVVGGAIAVGNVVVPSLIRRDFFERRVAMTAWYSVALALGGGVSAGLTVPLEHLTGWGWRPTVALWGIVAALGLLVWLPHARREPATAPGAELAVTGGLWRDRLAWCVTAFMGLQSLGFYSTLSWVPTILENHGVSAGQAGWLLSFSTLPSVIGALGTPALERRAARPGWLVGAAVALCAGAYVGLAVAPAHDTYVWMTLLGLGQGVSLALGLGYIVARAGNSHQAAHLSTMAQSAGYMVASAGPFLLGALHGLTGHWTVPLGLLLLVLVPLGAAGLVASRPGHVMSAAKMPPAGIEPASRA